MAHDRDFFRLKPEEAMDYENGFYWYGPSNRLAKLCAHYELYKRIISLPGEIIETGVFKASTLIRLATFRHFFEVPSSRGIYAFDAFGAFPRERERERERESKSKKCPDYEMEAIENERYSLPEDGAYASTYDKNFGVGLSSEEVIGILKGKGLAENVHCIPGDITETMPSFFEKNPYLRLSFVHVDVEVYEPTMTILELCWPRLVPGGIIALDDFNGTTGAAKAINMFFIDKSNFSFQKFPFADAPAYIQK